MNRIKNRKQYLLTSLTLIFIYLNSTISIYSQNDSLLKKLDQSAAYQDANAYLNSLKANKQIKYPSSYSYWKQLINYRLGNYQIAKDAIKSIDSIHQTDSLSIATLILAGKITLELGLLKNARQYFDAANIHPNIKSFEKVVLLDNLGLLEIEKENYIKADSFFQKALFLSKKESSSSSYSGIIYTHLGESYIEQEKHQQAKRSLEKANEILNTNLGKMHPQLALIWNHYARLYLNTDELKKAKESIEKSLNITRTILGKNHPSYWHSQQNLARFYQKKGVYDLAENILISLIKGYESLNKHHPKLALIYTNLGNISEALGNYEKAVDYYEKAVTILKHSPKTKLYLNISNNLANAYWEIGKLEEAEKIYLENTQIARSKLGNQHPQYAIGISSLAVFYDYNGQARKAEPLYLEAIALIEQIYGKEHEYYATNVYNLAWLYQLTERLNLAEKHFLEAAAIEKKIYGTFHPDYLITLYELANFYRRLHNVEKADRFFKQANNLQLELIKNYYSGFEEHTRLNYLKKASQNFNLFYSYLSKNKTSKLIKNAQKISMLTKGLSLDFYKKSKIEILSQQDTVLSTLYSVFQKEKKKLGKIYTYSKAQQLKANLNIVAQKNKVDLIEKEITFKLKQSNYSNISLYKTPFKDLQEKINANEVIIDFVKFKYNNVDQGTDTVHYQALLNIKDNSTPYFIPICTQKELKKLLQLSNQYGAGYAKYPEMGQKLYDLVWQPLEPYLKDITTIHLSPTGLLHKVAFEALPNAKGQLLNQYHFKYYGNLRDFINTTPINIPKNITLVGGAIFDIDSLALTQINNEKDAAIAIDTFQLDSITTPLASISRAIATDSTRNAIEFNYLPGTKTEVTQLAPIFQKKKWTTNTYTDLQASEDNIKKLNSSNAPGILHIATHGFFFDPYQYNAIALSDQTLRERIIGADSPLMRSGLVFTGVNHSWKGGKPIKGIEDGVLTAFEIANMDLSNTKLAVLSACETGLGDVESTEGVFGLQRAFKAAGVDKLLISLWKIPDAPTAELMQLFYQNFLDGMPFSLALQSAKISMSKRYSPFYWAGFVLIE